VLVLRGLVGIAFGLAFLFYPKTSLLALLYLFGAYALVDGVFALIQALRLGVHSDRWWPMIFEAIVGIAVGVLFFRFPNLSALAIAFTIAIWAFATGIFEIVAAFRIGSSGSPWLLGLGGVLSIVVGVLFTLVPATALIASVWVLGIYAIVFGIMIVVLGFRLRTSATATS